MAQPNSEFVAFDLETTGLSPKSDRIIEIGAVRFSLQSGATHGTLQILVNPDMPVPLAVQRLTGIAEADLAGQPVPVEAVAQLADFCDGAELVAHGSIFDIAFCSALVPEAFAHRQVFDTLDLARILLPLAASHSLPKLSTSLGLEHQRPHRALSDAEATAGLFKTLVAETGRLEPATLAEMQRVAAQGGTGLDDFFRLEPEPVARASRRPPAAQRPVSARPDGIEPPQAPVPVSGQTSHPDAGLAIAAARLIGPGGALGERPGYEYRQAQEHMVRAVAQTLDHGGRLLVEAGTGVGKTLAYLIPVALWLERGGGRAVVATNTITLQEQLRDHDLPALQPLLPRPLRAAMLKGRSHYISLRRWRRFLRRPDLGSHGADIEAIRFKLKILRWLDLTATGDRAELHLTDSELNLWRHVESTDDDCLGGACANWGNAACHMVAARRAARAAELVITNHSLLLADDAQGGQLLGDAGALVIDEAHHLEDSATRVGGHRLRLSDIAITLQRLPELDSQNLRAAVEACSEAAHRLFGETKGVLVERLGGEGSPSGSLGITSELLQDPRLTGLVRAAHHGVGVLIRAAEALRTVDPSSALTADLLPQPEKVAEELALAAAGLRRWASAIDEVLLHPRPGHVAWLELRAEQAELRDAPITPGAGLGEGLLDRARSTILTSATLAVAGDFGFVRERLGLGSRTEELALASPYDYLAQALCVLVSDIPPYDDPAYERALAAITGDIASRLSGRTLGLFTGYGALRRIRDLVTRRLEGESIAVLGQGLDGTRRQILGSFLANPRTVLLGTNTFWEGIDVPGDALQCVLIAKLPFAVPTDPLVRARTAELADPFSQYILPLAVIRLRQGFGRLIRSGSDRGAVVIADSRLQTRDYASRFLSALPPAAVVREPGHAVAARVAEFASAQPRLHAATEGGQSDS